MKNLPVLLRYLKAQFSISKEESMQETYAEIAEGVRFRGYNLWILGFAMVIACIGLNVDSVSAIIGAMLISPLMGPIVGLAFGMAINDRRLKQAALRNWLWMTIVSLLASVIFFLLSPFDDNTLALASFKKASIFDILLAFFGGMAGFIGIIKKEGIKIMAGVAVATACMPPLCTAGYGIAHWDWQFFIGGLYFYLINCLFIGLATFLLTRRLGYHIGFPEGSLSPTVKWFWYLTIAAMVMPGVYIAWQKWEEQGRQQEITRLEKTELERIERLEERVRELDTLLQELKTKN